MVNSREADRELVTAYGQRFGWETLPTRDRLGLERIHRAHIRTIPFENLDVVARRPISLKKQDLIQKLLRSPRGGGCFELHGLLAAYLSALGFPSHLVAGRYVNQRGEPSEPDDHAAVWVVAEIPYLLDVSFGSETQGPLPINHTQGGATDGLFITTGPSGDLSVRRRVGDQENDVFLVDPTPRTLSSFEAALRRHEQPGRPFARERVVRLATERGQLLLSGSRLREEEAGACREAQVEESQVMGLLRNRFGIIVEALGSP
ncbi:MAG TPA: arylamine N-acetyltransferase [Planctomycetota bacterium]|nr:arylamine N-acetyltransferase [Planctomycetota bacterium]